MQPRERNIVNTQILNWRTAISSREDKTPLVTILSQNAIDDKISLILVPLLSSLGVGLLKFIWRDEIAGQSLFNNLSVIPGMELPSNPEDILKLFQNTRGLYALAPDSITSLITCKSGSDLSERIRFEGHCLFTLYASQWKGIVFDMKVGDYPHRQTLYSARELALDLKEHCDTACMEASFFLSHMKQPVGQAVGPLLELREAVDVLRARGPFDLTKLVLELGADLLMSAKKLTDRTQVKSILRTQLQNGDALDMFKAIIQAHNGIPEITEDLYPLPFAEKKVIIPSPKEGYIQHIAMDRLFDLKNKLCSEHESAGLVLLKKTGDTTHKKDTLAEVYVPSAYDTQTVQPEAQKIFSISHRPPKFPPIIAEKIKGSFRF
jgi:pyrimidine-nucleoside phosphorylase